MRIFLENEIIWGFWEIFGENIFRLIIDVFLVYDLDSGKNP